ncbi:MULTISPECIES: hypothetical protein [Halomonadaceae]|uniref:hypothetical protein n=1 Tax=Halomonadaceae TaxID=28256 RepID=UPI00159B2464|nr:MULTISPECIES: hypothetical protein [Halomonas]QJQ94160.1 hypothetical protein HIO72_01880 [Halomonas sp. PA5]
MIRMNFWSGLGVSLLALVLLAWIIPLYGGSGAAFGLPPQLLATLGAWLMLGCALALTVLSGIQLRRSQEPLFNMPGAEQLWQLLWPFLYVLTFILLSILLPLTYIAPLLIGALLLILGERRWYVLTLSAMLPTAGLYVLTVYLMRIGVV